MKPKKHNTGKVPVLMPFPPMNTEVLRTFARTATTYAVWAWVMAASFIGCAVVSHVWFGAANRALTASAGFIGIAAIAVAGWLTCEAFADWRTYHKAKSRRDFRG